jgi:hypothetical protein
MVIGTRPGVSEYNPGVLIIDPTSGERIANYPDELAPRVSADGDWILTELPVTTTSAHGTDQRVLRDALAGTEIWRSQKLHSDYIMDSGDPAFPFAALRQSEDHLPQLLLLDGSRELQELPQRELGLMQFSRDLRRACELELRHQGLTLSGLGRGRVSIFDLPPKTPWASIALWSLCWGIVAVVLVELAWPRCVAWYQGDILTD